jgi:hypothetical protein
VKFEQQFQRHGGRRSQSSSCLVQDRHVIGDHPSLGGYVWDDLVSAELGQRDSFDGWGDPFDA